MMGVQKRKIQWVISLLLVMLYFSGLTAQAQYGGGTGEPNEPYLIYTAEQMNAIGADANDWDKHSKLMADIDLSAYTGTAFNIIGYWRAWNDKRPFTGVLDGNGHKIFNFTCSSSDNGSIGLFGYVDDQKAVIKNLGLIDPIVNGVTVDDVGTLVGHLGGGNIERCYAQGGTISGRYLVGGLVGYNYLGLITDCYAICTVTGNNGVGGLVGYFSGGRFGYNSEGTIHRCYASGSVIGNDDIGGLVGGSGFGGIIANCYSSASVTGNQYIGGLIGSSLNASRIVKCYSTGTVTGQELTGGLVGHSRWVDAAGSFWDIETSGLNVSSTGQGKTTAEMQTAGTFLDAGWDFVGESVNGTEDIWSICEGTNYPRLAWQIPAGDFVCPDGITIEDFVFFAEYWGDDNCDLSNDYCQGTDLDFSGTVDEADLEILFENWLTVGND